jgi:hypothetical protein
MESRRTFFTRNPHWFLSPVFHIFLKWKQEDRVWTNVFNVEIETENFFEREGYSVFQEILDQDIQVKLEKLWRKMNWLQCLWIYKFFVRLGQFHPECILNYESMIFAVNEGNGLIEKVPYISSWSSINHGILIWELTYV